MPPTIFNLFLPQKKRYDFILSVSVSSWQFSNLTPCDKFLLQIEAEASSVQAIARTLCPLKIILDRVFLTLIGVLLSCWQENQVTKRKEKSVSMNAFELISRSQSFNLDSFFEQQTSNYCNILCHSGHLTSCPPGIKIYGCISSLPADLAGSISSCRWSCCCWADDLVLGLALTFILGAGLLFGAKLFTRVVDVFHLIKIEILQVEIFSCLLIAVKGLWLSIHHIFNSERF
ncbi:uncharacterized protein LOC107641788 isoform X3 [Arachis ipaensis]|uniref:uncharacterized protein LOC107641788 isoform X3 n=1 Tax=Arachis ipaensis TaxID=130454 RepID=UPI000A2B65D8|nr:uncharacterized protein LOC107641788 isoform X3 [Arachis ipaensis]